MTLNIDDLGPCCASPRSENHTNVARLTNERGTSELLAAALPVRGCAAVDIM
jgi:hypothetical protein